MSLYNEHRCFLVPTLEDDRDKCPSTMPQLEDDGKEEDDGDQATEMTARHQELEQHKTTIQELREVVSTLEEKLGMRMQE